MRQSESAECGLACIAMIASYFGHNINLGTLRLKHSVSLKGSTLKGLIALANRLGLDSRALRLELESLNRLLLPCVLHWSGNHFVVLRKTNRKGYLIHDPARGERLCTRDELSSKFTGIALELRPGSTFKRRKNRVSMKLTDLLGRPRGLGRALAQTVLLSLIVQLFVLASPFYMQLVVDEVLTTFDTDLLTVLAIGFGLFMLINTTASALRSYVVLYLSNMLGYQIVSNLFQHLLRLPMQWFEKRHVGDILSRFSSTRPIRDLFTEGLVAAFIDGLLAATTLALILIYSAQLGAVVVGALVLYLLLRLALYTPLRQRNDDQIAATAAEQSVFIESIRGIQSIKVFGHESDRHSIWQHKYADAINNSVKIGKLRIGFNAANSLLFGIENTLVIYIGAKLVVDGQFTIGMLFAFIAYKNQFVDKATVLVERLIEFRLLGLHLERIADIGLAEPEQIQAVPAELTTPKFEDRKGGGYLEIDRVSFRYGAEEPWILKNVSLSITKGEMISLVGQSGCGKSTLMKILLGLLRPDDGQVNFRGHSLQRIGHNCFRRKIGTVMQEDALLAGSIADNIAFFDSEPDLVKIRASADAAAIHNDINSMPMGYDSLIGDMGGALSAGQKQRVLLARALYRDPEILILDEGTANLDPVTEEIIIQNLSDMQITRICVAHRQAIIDASDRVVVMESGTLRRSSATLRGWQGERGHDRQVI